MCRATAKQLQPSERKLFFAVPLSAVGFLGSQALRDDLEVVEAVVELQVVIDGLLTVLIAHIRVFASI